MRKRYLLFTGLVALTASLIGPTVQPTISGDTAGWDLMSGYGHMGWLGSPQSTGNVIEGATEKEVAATEFAFSPDELTVAVGEPVNLTLVNAGDLPHDLVIPELDVRLAADTGGQATTGVEFDQVGSYQFVCSYSGHADAGMNGLLTVKPNT